MKQKFLNSLRLRLCALVALVLCSAGTAWGEDVAYTLSFSKLTSGTNYNSYTAAHEITCNNVGWSVMGNQSVGDNIRVGGKTTTATDRTLTSKAVLSSTKAIGKVVINHAGTGNGKDSKITINSITVEGSTNSSFSNSIKKTISSPSVSSTGALEFIPDEDWAMGSYFKVTVNYQITGQNNCYLTINNIVFYESNGTPTVATPTFSPAAGTYTTAQNVTISTTPSDADIYYTTNGSVPSATNGTKYTGAISVNSKTTIKAIAIKGNYNNSNVAEAEYNIVTIEHAGTETDPYSVADARSAIDASTGMQNVYATGIVSAIPTAYSTEYSNITFNFVDNEGDNVFLQAYRCGGDDAAEVQVGDVVIVYGNLKKHGDTYEFDEGCSLVSLIHPSVAVETPAFSLESGIFEDEQTVTISCATSGARIYYTTDGSDPTNGSSLYEAPITINSNTVLKAIALLDNDYSIVKSATYYFPEKKTVAEALSIIDALTDNETTEWIFDISGTVSTAGTLSSGTITYKISDDVSSDELTVYKGKGLNNEAFTSADDIKVGDDVTVRGKLKKYVKNNIITPEIDQGNFLHDWNRPEPPVVNPTVNVGTLTNITAVEMWYFEANSVIDIEDGDNVAAGTEVFVSPIAAEGFTVESITVIDENNQELELTENSGSWSFVIQNSSVTISVTGVESSVTPTGDPTLTNANIVAAGTAASGYTTWTITDTNNKTWEAYAIKNKHSNVTSDYHFLQIKKYASNTAYYIQVPEYGTKITKLEMTVSATSQPMDGGGNGTTLFFSADNKTSATGDGVASGTGQKKVTIDCSSLNLNTGYITAAGAVRIWDVNVTYEEGETATITISADCYGDDDGTKYYATYSNESAFVVPEDLKVAEIELQEDGTFFVEFYKPGVAVPANTGVMVSAEVPGEYTVVLSNEDGESVFGEDNCLRPTGNSGITAGAMATADSGCTFYRLTMHNETEIGFWWGADKGAAFALGANKAYMAVPKSNLVKGFALSDFVNGIKAVETQKAESNVIYNLAGQRVSKMQKGLYIVNGKKMFNK